MSIQTTNSHASSGSRLSERALKVATPEPVKAAQPVSHEAIAKRAYEKYLARSCVEGFAQDDWLAAELELNIE